MLKPNVRHVCSQSVLEHGQQKYYANKVKHGVFERHIRMYRKTYISSYNNVVRKLRIMLFSSSTYSIIVGLYQHEK